MGELFNSSNHNIIKLNTKMNARQIKQIVNFKKMTYTKMGKNAKKTPK